ncbi:MAG TPA: transposase [Ktedonobacterales bacterium]|nr:transposase [Ktedonobacterales bacterium]
MQTVRKTFKYKLQPTPAQEWELERMLMLCGTLYNTALEQRIAAWQGCRVSVSRFQQEAERKSIRAELPEYAAIHSHVLQDVLARLDKTSQACFRRVQAGQTPGFPRCKGRARFPSFTCKEDGNGARLENGVLVLSKIGRIAGRWSRPIAGTPKTVTFSKAADGWYVAFSCAFSCADVACQPVPLTGQETGIDLGLDSFATLANGSQITNPRSFRVAEPNLKRAQRRVARRKKVSNRRKKAVVLLAKAHAKVRRARQDFHHKTALALGRQYDTIYHEDLQTANMVQNHHLAKSIADAGWSAFLAILSFKAVEAGKTVVAVPPAFTLQACSGCGVLVQKGLSGRWHSCPACGASLHRDHNAARNILRLGQASRAGQSVQASTWAVGPCVA